MKSAESLRIDPSQCVVFEDSLSGIESAGRAGMKVIGVTTTHLQEEMGNTEFAVSDFDEVMENYLSYFF